MSGTEAQKDKCSAGGQPDTPAGKLRGRIGNLQVTNAANKVRRARHQSIGKQQDRYTAGQKQDKAVQRGWGNMEGKPKVQAGKLSGWGNCRECMQLKRQ